MASIFHSPRRRAFTLVELLVVIAIIGILVALLLPAIQAAREAGRRSSCQNQIRQLAIALHNHHDTRLKFPAGAQQDVYPSPNPTQSTTAFRGTSWIVLSLPYMEQQPLYQQYDQKVSYTNAINKPVAQTIIQTLYCPSGPVPTKYLDTANGWDVPATPLSPPGSPSTHYCGVMGPGGAADNTTYTFNLGPNATPTNIPYRIGDAGANAAWSGHGILSQYRDTAGSISTFRNTRMQDVTDGTANTFLLGELSRQMPPGVASIYRSWIRGNNGGTSACKNMRYPINSTFYNGSNNFNDVSFGSEHPYGTHFALADGAVRYVNQKTPILVLIAYSSMNGGEQVTLDQN
jgi:prepilin-type N-terminal cleavage/methylation domain-containing protein